jgi:hypothetical protein
MQLYINLHVNSCFHFVFLHVSTYLINNFLARIYLMGQILQVQMSVSYPGAHLKKLRRAEGGAKIFGVFRVKNHHFTPKNHIFSNFRPGAPSPLYPPLCWYCRHISIGFLLIQRKDIYDNENKIN